MAEAEITPCGPLFVASEQSKGTAVAKSLIDGCGREVSYLRVSVTDRCDLLCRYCRVAHGSYWPRADVLTLEELDRICSLFVSKGIRKIRLTGGEPLVRRNIDTLMERLSRHLDPGPLQELVVTTNGTRLAAMASRMYECGIRRVNVSCDSLDPKRFREVTGGGELSTVLEGIAKATKIGLSIKINTVILNGINDGEVDDLIAWCGDAGHDLTLIELMPFSQETMAISRTCFLPLSVVRSRLNQKWNLLPLGMRSGGPAAYFRVVETGGKLGFISSISSCFCQRCNRLRLTASGQLQMCLGNSNSVDIKTPMRSGADDAAIWCLIEEALRSKPAQHDFADRLSGKIGKSVNDRGMNAVGG